MAKQAVDFERCYRILGLEPGCSWMALKARHRELVQRWHPDRHPTPLRADAEHRLKEINRAFSLLENELRRTGALPRPSPTRSTAVRARPRKPEKHRPQRSTPARAGLPFRNLIPVLFVAAGGLAAYLAVLGPAQQGGQGSSPSRREDATAAARAHFSIGDPKSRVFAVQGPPSRVDGDTWYYGRSAVFFRDGAVDWWRISPDDPLQVRARLPAAPGGPAYFSIGSTKAEVRAIQGPPTRDKGQVWLYGTSEVVFHDGRVQSWHSSALHPLKARRPGGR